MARTKGSSGKDTKLRLLTAARALLADAGPEGLTMRALGAEVGVQAGAIYRYYPDKDALLVDILSRALQEQDHVIGQINRHVGAEVALEHLVGSYLSWQATSEYAGLIAPCRASLGAAGDAQVAATASLGQTTQDIINDGQEAGVFRVPDTQLAARAVLAVLDEVSGDTRLALDRQQRVGWTLVRRLVNA